MDGEIVNKKKSNQARVGGRHPQTYLAPDWPSPWPALEEFFLYPYLGDLAPALTNDMGGGELAPPLRGAVPEVAWGYHQLSYHSSPHPVF